MPKVRDFLFSMLLLPRPKDCGGYLEMNRFTDRRLPGRVTSQSASWVGEGFIVSER